MKHLFNLFLSMGLASVCFLSGCKEGDYSKHKVVNTELLSTNVFLDEPDFMVYMYDKTEKTLSEEERVAIYEDFLVLMENLSGTTTIKTPFSVSGVNEFRDEYGGVEFRYNRRRKFVGSLPPCSETDYFTWGELTFDAFLLVPYSAEVLAIPYLDGKYIGINNLFLGLSFSREAYVEFAETLEELR